MLHWNRWCHSQFQFLLSAPFSIKFLCIALRGTLASGDWLAQYGWFQKINASCFSKVIITNTVPHLQDVFNCKLIDIIDVSWLCSESIRRVQEGNSLTVLYDSVDNVCTYEFDVKVLNN